MSYITYKNDDIVYVEGIGYGTLTNCGKFNTISMKTETVSRKNDSFIFAPEMFRTESEAIIAKRQPSPEQKVEEVNKNIDKMSEGMSKGQSKSHEEHKQPPKPREVNIVSVRLQKNWLDVYTCDTNIKKNIDVVVKPILTNKFDQITINIEINKTIETLKKLIFEKLEESISNYYDIKLYTVSPVLTEFNIPSKTIIQYAIKDGAKIVLSAKYAFGFQEIPKELSENLKSSNGGYTIARQKGKTDNKNPENKQLNKVPSNSVQLMKAIGIAEKEGGDKIMKQIQRLVEQQSKQISQEIAQTEATSDKKDDEEKKTEPDSKPEPEKSLPMTKNTHINTMNIEEVAGKAEFTSGRHYWEYKLDKGTGENDIWLGFTTPELKNESKMINWAYLPLGGKKYIKGEWSDYGFSAKPSDNIGVLLKFDSKGNGTIAYYKNSINCGQFCPPVKGPLIPVVGLGNDAQVSIDSRASFPLDCYRSLK